MRTDNARPRSPDHANSRLRSFIAGGCCVICLASIPVTTASSARTRANSTSPATSQTTSQPSSSPSGAHRDGEGASGTPAGNGPAPSSAGKRAKGAPADGHATHGHEAPTGAGAPQSGAGGQGAQGAEDGQRGDGRHHDAHSRQDGSSAGGSGSRADGRKIAGGRVRSTGGVSGPAVRQVTGVLPAARTSKPVREKGPGHQKEKTKEPKGGKQPKQHERGNKGHETPPVETPKSGGGSSASSDAPQATAAVAANPVGDSAPAAPAAGQAPAGADISTPAVSRRAAQHSTHARRARANARAGRAGYAFASAAPVRSIGSAGAQRVPAGHGHQRGHKSPTQVTSPLTTTITKIVGVVPTPVRVLIAGLVALALALAARSGAMALRARRLERQRAQLLEDVGLLQAALLPVPPERIGPVGTSVAYQPAAGPGAGGDFYDVFALEDGRVAVIVGDVSGHGRRALPHTALLRYTLRAYLEAGLSPREAVQTAGSVLDHQLEGLFATVVAGVYDPRERVLVYSCAGHPPPVMLSGEGCPPSIAPVTACSAPPIGVGMRTGTRQTSVSVPGGSRLCFYTDGVTEARVGSELFGSQRLADALVQPALASSASAILDRVVHQADAHPDDMAACLLSVEGGDGAPSVIVEELEVDREQAGSERTAQFLHDCGMAVADVADAARAARAAAGPAGTVVLELRRSACGPALTLRREHLAFVHQPRDREPIAQAQVAL